MEFKKANKAKEHLRTTEQSYRKPNVWPPEGNWAPSRTEIQSQILSNFSPLKVEPRENTINLNS